jgi:hypothetical protein
MTTCPGTNTCAPEATCAGIPTCAGYTTCTGSAQCACSCPHQADLDGTTFVDATDLAILIDVVFFGLADVQDVLCPGTRSEFNCDGFVDAVDLAFMIDHVFFGGPGPCDPCNCTPYPTNCPPFPGP